MTLTWHVPGTLRIRGTPSHFWLYDGDDIPATFSVVDPDGTAWSWAVFLPDEMRVGRAPLAKRSRTRSMRRALSNRSVAA